ncbi:proteasome regulatory particle base subunit, partial [Spiromyces aspiralis]
MADEEKVKLDSKSAKANLEQKKQQGEDLSEEDVIVIQELERIVSSIQQEVGKSNELPATKELRDLLMISKSSMASVTKHLKFLKPHYGPLVQLLKTSTRPTDKYLLADVLSFVGMIYGRDSKDALNFRLMVNEYRKNPSADQSDLIEAISAYGHEYARYLALEIKQSYAENQDSEGEEDLMKVDDTSEKLIDLARVIAQFFILKGPDLDAIDLLSEVNCVREIPNIISADIYDRVCKYLVSCSQTLPHEDAVVFLEAAHNIYTRYGTPLDRLPLSLKLGDNERVLKDFGDCQTSAERKQAAFLLSRQRFDITQLGKHDDEFLSMCLQGTYLSDYYLR